MSLRRWLEKLCWFCFQTWHFCEEGVYKVYDKTDWTSFIKWYELCPASRRHLSVFIRSGFRTVFALNGKETFSISVQYHLQLHRWCSVHSKLFKQGYLAERLKSSFRKFYGRYGDLIQQYEVFLPRMLNDILILDQQWLPNQSDFPPISLPLYRAWPSSIMSGFHEAFATGVACQQGTLTLPDTWFRPPLGALLELQLLRPDSANLQCLYSTFHLEYTYQHRT